jgi:cell division protease FtsH
MSENVGPVFYEHRNEHPFLGQVVATDGGTSDATVHLIEQEARRLLGRAAEDAKKTITQHRDRLDRLATALLSVETVERAELMTLLGPSSSATTLPKSSGLSALPDAQHDAVRSSP